MRSYVADIIFMKYVVWFIFKISGPAPWAELKWYKTTRTGFLFLNIQAHYAHMLAEIAKVLQKRFTYSCNCNYQI